MRGRYSSTVVLAGRWSSALDLVLCVVSGGGASRVVCCSDAVSLMEAGVSVSCVARVGGVCASGLAEACSVAGVSSLVGSSWVSAGFTYGCAHRLPRVLGVRLFGSCWSFGPLLRLGCARAVGVVCCGWVRACLVRA